MKKEIVPAIGGKHVIAMKGGLTLLVSAETAIRLSKHLVDQEAHSFVKVDEIGETVNTAEIEGVYTPEKHQEMMRLRGGEYLCSFAKWHEKKQKCDCAYELARDREREIARIRNEGENRPPTPEERARSRPILAKLKKDLIAKGVIAAKGSRTLKRSALVNYKKTHGVDYNVPAGFLIDEET